MLARASWRLAAVSAAGATVGLGHFTNWDAHEASLLVQSLPRTTRLLSWAAASLYRHHALAAASPAGLPTPAQLSEQRRTDAAELKEVCRQNGGIYVKAAQFASNLLSVPEEYRAELGALLDDCRPVPLAAVRTLVEAETGRPLEASFAAFSTDAVAAASLAQVHRATLHDGRAVAVKVQYPGMAVAVAADLRVCGLLASAYALLGGEHVALARNVLRDLTARLRAEVDFRNETRNAQRLVAKLAVPGVSVPATVHELSGKRVLTMEWVDGVRISDVAGLHARGIDTKAAGARLLAAFADMLYVHGDLHGDLHPGNILVRGGGDAFEIVLLDHGWYVPLADALRKQYCRLWCAFVLRDSATAQAVAAEIAGPKGSAIVPAVLSLGASQRGATARDGGAAASTSGGGGLSLGGLESLSAISHFPSEVVEILRGSQAARNIGAALGCLASDRLAINARAALAGLSVATSSDGRVRYWNSSAESWQEWRLSWQLGARIRLLRALLWCKSVKDYLEACWFALYHSGDVIAAGKP